MGNVIQGCVNQRAISCHRMSDANIIIEWMAICTTKSLCVGRRLSSPPLLTVSINLFFSARPLNCCSPSFTGLIICCTYIFSVSTVLPLSRYFSSHFFYSILSFYIWRLTFSLPPLLSFLITDISIPLWQRLSSATIKLRVCIIWYNESFLNSFLISSWFLRPSFTMQSRGNRHSHKHRIKLSQAWPTSC